MDKENEKHFFDKLDAFLDGQPGKEYVKVKHREGPVIVESLSGRGAKNEYMLWDKIEGYECFPQTFGSACYFLALRREVQTPEEVELANAELKQALQLLSHVWVFAGGSLMNLQDITTNIKPKYTSNAAEIKEHLLAQKGLREVTANFCISVETSATYQTMPLKRAIELCVAAKKNSRLNELFRYYHGASTNREIWFADVYKIRDALTNEFDNEQKTRKALNICKSDWKFFGKVLNVDYDLRHAPKNPTISASVKPEEVERVKQLAYQWIKDFLAYLTKAGRI
jgi:hypothetical protein